MLRSHEPLNPASKRTRALAGAIDAGLLALAGAAVLIGRWRAHSGENGPRPILDGLNDRRLRAVLQIVGPLGKVLTEQLGSPGQRVVGLRTVDSRTGQRIALWRTLLLSGLEVGSKLLSRRLTTSRHAAEGSARHEEDDGFAQAVRPLYEKHRVDAPMWRFVLTVSVGVGLGRVQRLLRSRLAPRLMVFAPSRRVG